MSRTSILRQAWLVALLLTPCCILSPAARAAGLTCAQLASDKSAGLIGNPAIVRVNVDLIPAGAPENLRPPSIGPLRPSSDAFHAAYCRVNLTYSSRGDRKDGYAAGQKQHIRVTIGLPLNDLDGGKGGKMGGAWNGNIENLGGGGCVGIERTVTPATDEGYVGSFTDTGHTDEENGSGREQRCDFGVIQYLHVLNKGLINDFIYEGVHQQVDWARKLTQAYYGAGAQRNYWNGCSTGGRQGLALAQEFGDEFDGFAIGAPAIYWQEFRLADAWPALVVKDRLIARGKDLSDGQYVAANRSAVAACDVSGLDKVEDGLIDDPRACSFSAKKNICGVAGAPDAPNCLDADQASAIDEIWAGPVNEHGKRVWYPFNTGNRSGIKGIPGSAAQVMSYNHGDLTISTSLLFVDEAAKKAAGSPPGAMTYAEEAALGSKVVADLMETQKVDLDKARKRGAKILMWHGTEDPAIRWMHSLDYYRRVATRYGNGKADFAALQSWFRYYHAPGVSHCGGGEGPAPINPFQDMVRWVETGKAPDSIAAKGGSLNPERTRPLCPWPKTAVYKGVGSTDDASNFSCDGDLDANPKALCSMLRTQFGGEAGSGLDGKAKGISEAACN